MMTRLAGRLLLVGLLAGCCISCVSNDQWGEGEETSEDRLDFLPTSTVMDHRVFSSNVALFQGYSPFFEQATDTRCIKETLAASDQPNASQQRVQVSGVQSRLDYVLVTSREQLAKELGVDLDLKIKYGVGNINPTFSLIDSFKNESRSVFVLITAAHTYKVTKGPGLALDITADAAARASDPSSFLPTCGSHYVDAITYGGRVLLGLRFDVLSLDGVNQIKGGLGLGVGVGPVGIEANFGAQLKDAIQRSGATVALSVVSDGYLMDQNGAQGVDATSEVVKALLGGAFFNETTVTSLHNLASTMAKSVKDDLCRDAPNATGCDGSGPGYGANTARHASVMSVDLRPYASLPTAPRGAPWLAMRDALKKADQTLRGLAPFATKMEDAHRLEVKAFLDASDRDKNRFGIASNLPNAVARDQIDLMNRAMAWDARLRPFVGSDIAPLEELVERCFSSASVGVFSECDPQWIHGPIMKQAETAFRTYQAEGRVLPLVYTPIEPMTLSAAKAKCDSLKHQRLPSRSEVEKMAVAVRRAADLAPGGDLPRTVWHAGPSEHCTAFYNPPNAGSDVSLDRCPDTTIPKLPAFCVPSDGPFAR